MNAEQAGRLGAAQAALRDDMELLLAYGESFPEVWTGIRFEGPRLVVLLTAPALHRERILAMVANPTLVDVRSAPYSRRRLDEVYEQVIALIGQESRTWTSHGPGLERVHVTLRASEDTLASRLHDRFADALEIRLGAHRYPLSEASSDPPLAARATFDLPDLHLSTEVECHTWQPGETIRGLLRLTNVSATEILRLDTSSTTTGALLDPNGVTAGGYSGWIAGVGRSIELKPSAVATIDFLAGSDTFDASRGAVLPDGDYLLEVRLRVSSPVGAGLIVAPPVPIRLKHS